MKGQSKGRQFYAWAESKISFKKGGKAYIYPIILTLHFGIGFGIGIGIDSSFVVYIGPKANKMLGLLISLFVLFSVSLLACRHTLHACLLVYKVS